MRYLTHDLRHLEGRELLLIPFGDVHLNTRSCDQEKFYGLIDGLVKKQRKGAVIRMIGCGDYNDPFSPSERAVVQAGQKGYGLHETTYEELDRLAYQVTDQFLETIRPLGKEAVLTLLEGHHYMRFHHEASEDLGKTTTQYMCRMLGCPYGAALVHITIRLPHGLDFRVVATHGAGGAQQDGARVNKRLRMMNVFRDGHLYLMGHDNSKFITEKQIIEVTGRGTRARKVLFCGTGSFQRAYMEDPWGSYVEPAMLEPHGLGTVQVVVRVEQRKGKWRLDYHASV